jgi:hypothetical protein
LQEDDVAQFLAALNINSLGADKLAGIDGPALLGLGVSGLLRLGMLPAHAYQLDVIIGAGKPGQKDSARRFVASGERAHSLLSPLASPRPARH